MSQLTIALLKETLSPVLHTSVSPEHHCCATLRNITPRVLETFWGSCLVETSSPASLLLITALLSFNLWYIRTKLTTPNKTYCPFDIFNSWIKTKLLIRYARKQVLQKYHVRWNTIASPDSGFSGVLLHFIFPQLAGLVQRRFDTWHWIRPVGVSLVGQNGFLRVDLKTYASYSQSTRLQRNRH